GHSRRNLTRRQLLGHGVGLSVGVAFASPLALLLGGRQARAGNPTARLPFLTVEGAGGGSIAGSNVIVGKKGGQYFTRQFELTDTNDVVVQVEYIPIGENLYEHHSFFYEMREYSRGQYVNMMPTTRDIVSFSQTVADGVFSLGSHFCITMFNSGI